jgi:hypothetical protein
VDIDTFITQVSTGESAAAKDTLNDILSQRAFDALATKKQEMSATVFNGKEQEVESETEIESEAEETQTEE